MIRNKNITAMTIVIMLIVVGVFNESCFCNDIPRKTAKLAIVKSNHELEFKLFVKEKEFLDDPSEIASKEAEKLLNLIEKIMIPANDKPSNREWEKEYITSLRNGNDKYELIMPGIYIVKSGIAIYVADTNASKYTELINGENLEIEEQGVTKDGTGWILCGYGGLSHGIEYTGYNMITWNEGLSKSNVNGTSLVNESIGESVGNIKKGSYEYYCGDGDDKITDIAGEILGYKLKDINNNGEKELIFSVKEINCKKKASKPISRTIRYKIHAGKAKQLN